MRLRVLSAVTKWLAYIRGMPCNLKSAALEYTVVERRNDHGRSNMRSWADRLLGTPDTSKEEQELLNKEIIPGPGLASKEQALLEDCLRRSSYPKPEDDTYHYVREKTAQTIREWLTVDTKADYPKVTLDNTLVPSWISRWNSRGRMLTMVGKGIEDAAAGLALTPPIDGAQEHWLRIAPFAEMRLRAEQDRKAAAERSMLSDTTERLTKIANTPLKYGEQAEDTGEGIAPSALYGDFAAHLRQENLSESLVFDLVTELSKMVQQSQVVFPKLTVPLTKQLEARVLLGYYKQEQAQLEQSTSAREQQYEQQQQADRTKRDQSEATGALQSISDQLSSLNTVAERQAKDTSTNTFLHIVDGLFGR